MNRPHYIILTFLGASILYGSMFAVCFIWDVVLPKGWDVRNSEYWWAEPMKFLLGSGGIAGFIAGAALGVSSLMKIFIQPKDQN